MSIVNSTMAKAGLGGDNGLAITGGAKIMVGSCEYREFHDGQSWPWRRQ